MTKTELPISPTMAQAIVDSGLTNRELADKAKVSFKTLAEVRNGFADLESSKRRSGAARSLTRLATALGEDVSTVLREVGLDPSDPTIGRSIKLAEVARTTGLDDVDGDPILSFIRHDPKKPPRTAIITNPPIHPVGHTLPSIADALFRGILGSLDHRWSSAAEPTRFEQFADAEIAMQKHDSVAPHLCMGLYDLPARHHAGIDLVPIPGLSIKIGGLTNKENLNWVQLMTQFRDPRSAPHVLCIEGDVGERWINGPVTYPHSYILPPLKESSLEAIEERFATEFEKARNGQYLGGLVFVADGPLIARFHAIQRFGEKFPGFRLIKAQEAPSWRFGIGLTGDAPEFKRRLENAIREDLLGTTFARTVSLYCQLLLDDFDETIRLDLSELERIRPGLSTRFQNIARDLYAADETRRRVIFRKAEIEEAKTEEAGIKEAEHG